jgi:hypothetical protein
MKVARRSSSSPASRIVAVLTRTLPWLVLALACHPYALSAAQQDLSASELAVHRAGLVEHAERLADRGDLSGLERFAAFVQHAADRAVTRLGAAGSGRAAIRAFLDDLVDVSVSAEHAAAKRLVMVSPALYDGPPVHEAMFGTHGWAPRFRGGEGVIRHFAMSSAASYAFPPLWVELMARRLGGDLFPRPGTDGAADVAVNAAGRDFGLWLRAVEPDTFADGESVGRWIRARLGDTVP